MKLHEYLRHNTKLENISQAFIENLVGLKNKYGTTIRDAMTGLYIEACEECAYSAEELKIYRTALDKFEQLIESAEEEIKRREFEEKEKKKKKKLPSNPNY